MTAARSLHGDRLAWSASVPCPARASAAAVFGWEENPDPVRKAIIARDGIACVQVDGLANRSRWVAILATLRRPGSTLGEATEAYGRPRGNGITGPPVAMRPLVDHLTTVGAIVTRNIRGHALERTLSRP